MGYRFRLFGRNLPGRPDLVLPRHRVTIFVHGCFWHRHHCRFGQATPKTRASFWREKFAGNVERDQRNLKALRRLGWRTLVVWECQTRRPDTLLRRLERFLTKANSRTRPGRP
jgi:DNA mismatch endonuclease (patch repair protein)